MNERSQSVACELDVASAEESLANREQLVTSAYEVEEPSVVHEATIINVKRQRAIRLLMATGTIVVVVAVVAPVVILSGSKVNDSFDIQFSAIIENLCSPRHIAVYDSSLFVPEAGVGPIQVAGDRESEALCLPSSLPQFLGRFALGTRAESRNSIWMEALQMTRYSQVSLVLAPPKVDLLTRYTVPRESILIKMAICLRFLVSGMSTPQKWQFRTQN